MQFVSGLPATGILPASQREAPAEIAKPAPARVVPATSQPALAAAVVQPHSAERSAAALRKRANFSQGHDTVLTGPPPAFEINLLQHIRETRTDPEPLIPPLSTDVAETATAKPHTPGDPALQPGAEDKPDRGLPPVPQTGTADRTKPAETDARDWPSSTWNDTAARKLDLAL